MDQPRALREPRFTRIADGIWAQVEDDSAILPRHLDASAHEGRIALCRCRPLLESMVVLSRTPVLLAGTRLACRDQHDFAPFITGTYRDLHLRLAMCRYCGTVEVRDVSLHVILDEGARGKRFITMQGKELRKSKVLGWYAGRRISGRVYR